MTLFSAAAFYLLAGTAAFIRPALDPNNPKPHFDYCFGVLFGTGVGLFLVAIPAAFFPSPYWNLALLFFVARAVYLIHKRTKPLFDA